MSPRRPVSFSRPCCSGTTLFRGQLGTSYCFLEEMYARHLGHLFVSPLRPVELVLAVFTISLVRVLVGVGGGGPARPSRSTSSGSGTALGWALIPVLHRDADVRLGRSGSSSGLVLRLGLGAEEPRPGPPSSLPPPADLGRLLPGRHPARAGSVGGAWLPPFGRPSRACARSWSSSISIFACCSSALRRWPAGSSPPALPSSSPLSQECSRNRGLPASGGCSGHEPDRRGCSPNWRSPRKVARR